MRDQDKLAILQASGDNLTHVEVDGISVVTNSRVIFTSPPFTSAVVYEDGYNPTPESVQKYWRSLPERLGKAKPVRISGNFKHDDLFVTELTNKAPLNTGYLYLFDGCEVFSAGETDPAIFVRDGTIVGAVMPMRDLSNLKKCDPPTLEDVLTLIRHNQDDNIKALEDEIDWKRKEIQSLESEISELEKEIAVIRKRKGDQQ